MNLRFYFFAFACLICFSVVVFAQSTPILIGGEGTELSPDGIITGNGSMEMGGLGAALLDTFIIHYQPLGEGDWVDEPFPDPEVYSFQMNIPAGVPDYQSQGAHGNFWDSRGRNEEGILPWIREGDARYNDRYRPTGDAPLFGEVESDVQWTIDYWGGDEDNRFIHTIFAGTVEDFCYDEDSGNATALLVLLETTYLGYGDDGEPGPGLVEYAGGAYQGFDSFREPSGPLSHPAFFFEYDGDSNTGALTPCGTKIALKGENGWLKGYFDVIQEAIDVSEDGDTILVHPGTYVENINFSGKDIVVGSLFLTTGDTAYVDSTIIDGDSSGTVVTFENGESEAALLTGFTITGGYTDGNGGGVNCVNSSPTIAYCYIIENRADVRGGGISCEPEAHPVITDCRIGRNTVGSGGGGIWIGENSDPTIIDCRIHNNEARWNGGGINIYLDCAPLISGCSIDSNSARGKGGGIIVSQGCSPVVEHCEIRYNFSEDRGGGILVERQATPTFRWCAEYENGSDANMGLGLACIENSAPRFINCNFNYSWTHLDWVVPSFFISASHPVFVNCILYYNQLPDIYFDPDSAASSITITYSDIQGGREIIDDNDNGEVNWLDGNIDAVPQFVDLNEGDLNLAENSPCIDAGTAFFVWDEDTLVDLSEDDYHSIAPDMGAFESEFINSAPDPFGIHPSSFILFPAYPNPFNSTTAVTYSLPMDADVSLAVYDITGRLVAELVHDRQVAGVHRILWDGRTGSGKSAASGIYLCLLNGSGDDGTQYRTIQRMVLLK